MKLLGFSNDSEYESLSPSQVLDALGITASVTELNYVRNVTSAIQTQLDSKQASLQSSTSITLNGTQLRRAALTGDVTASANSNTTTISNNAVSNAKLADVPTGTLKGRVASGTGNVQDLTAAQVRTLLNVEDRATNGANWATNLIGIPANITSWAGISPSSKFNTPTGNTSQYIRGDGTLATFPTVPDASDFVARAIPQLDPMEEISGDNSGYGTVLQPFRIGKNSSVDPPPFFGTNLTPYLWMGSSGSSNQQGAILSVYASSSNNARELAFRGRSGSGWSDWARVWHNGNFDPDSKAPVANPVFEGDLTVSTSLASGGVIVERRNQPYNSSIEYKTTAGSIWAGYGNNGTIGFSVGGSSNLTAGNTWFKAQDGAAYIYQGTTPREVWHAGNQLNIGSTAASARSALGLGSAATSSISDFASSSDFNYIGSISGGSYYDYLPPNRGVSYFYHAAGNSPTDAPASPARQTAVLGMDTSWGTTQLAITNEDTPQVFVRGNGVTPWNRVWTAGDFDPTAQPASNITSGTFAAARIPNLPASKITSGTFAAARIPDLSSSYVATSGNQTGIAGNKTFTGSITANVLYGASFRSTSGAGDLCGSGSGAGIRLMPNGFSTTNMTDIDGSGNMTVRGSISDSIGNVRKPEYRTANGTITLNSNDVNRIVEKSNNSSYTYTIPSGHGSHGDIITFVNSGTSGNLTINRASGVTLYRNGTNANITVGPGSTVTVYRSATANRWIA